MKQRTLEEFTQFVLDNLREYLPEELADAKIWTEPFVKGNEHLTALIVTHPSSQTAPRIYIDYCMEAINGGKKMRAELKEIAQAAVDALRTPSPLGAMSLADYSSMRPRLVVRMFDIAMCREYLADKVYTEHAGLAATYRILVSNPDEDTIATVPITWDMLNMWGVGVEELRRDTVEAENASNPVKLYAVPLRMSGDPAEAVNLMKSVESQNLFEGTERLPVLEHLYVLTTKRHMNGSSALARPGVLEKVGRLLGTSYFLVPTTTHDLFIIPEEQGRSQRQLATLQDQLQKDNEVNPPDDMLSDHVLFYDRRARRLRRRTAYTLS